MLDQRFFERVATTNKKHGSNGTATNICLESYKAVYARSTMVLFSRKTHTPLAALTLKADDVGCLGMFTARPPPPQNKDTAHFQGMLNMPNQLFTLTISNLSDLGMINFNILHTPGYRVSTVDPGPAFGINEVNELHPNQSYTVQADQRNNCRMILAGKTKAVVQGEETKPVSVRESEQGSEHKGLYFYLSVVADRACQPLVTKFAEGTIWKVVPGFVRQTTRFVTRPTNMSMLAERSSNMFLRGAPHAGIHESRNDLLEDSILQDEEESIDSFDAQIGAAEPFGSPFEGVSFRFAALDGMAGSGAPPRREIPFEQERGSSRGLMPPGSAPRQRMSQEYYSPPAAAAVPIAAAAAPPPAGSALRQRMYREYHSPPSQAVAPPTVAAAAPSTSDHLPPSLQVEAAAVPPTLKSFIRSPASEPKGSIGTSHVDVGSTQAGELRYGEQINVSAGYTGHEYDYDHPSEPTVLCLSIWHEMEFFPLPDINDELSIQVKEWLENEGKNLIEALNAIYTTDTCVIDLESEPDTIICTCGHQCINAKNVSKSLKKCPMCRNYISAFVRADGLVLQ